jgi:hypothetical protein
MAQIRPQNLERTLSLLSSVLRDAGIPQYKINVFLEKTTRSLPTLVDLIACFAVLFPDESAQMSIVGDFMIRYQSGLQDHLELEISECMEAIKRRFAETESAPPTVVLVDGNALKSALDAAEKNTD